MCLDLKHCTELHVRFCFQDTSQLSIYRSSESRDSLISRHSGLVDTLNSRTCDIKYVIKTCIRGSKVTTETKEEIHFVLPFEELGKGSFVGLFAVLEEAKQALGIESYGVSDTTLEEVFLKVIASAAEEEGEPQGKCKFD